MSKLGKSALNNKVKQKQQKFEFPRGENQWAVVEYFLKNPELQVDSLYRVKFFCSILERLIEKNIIEKRHIKNHSKLRLNPKLSKDYKEKLGLGIQRRALIRKFQRD
ncbi:MAG: hypothetical protein QF381_03695 [Nitrososphaerales archaeon]|jgi:hypothetical protein|nr:hypothetical protein [Nitrososphaerales archaeon]|tara:strand:+ start:514 stop:834 length:321 start_codon:yes stop_codon:yes gene_type:complete